MSLEFFVILYLLDKTIIELLNINEFVNFFFKKKLTVRGFFWIEWMYTCISLMLTFFFFLIEKNLKNIYEL